MKIYPVILAGGSGTRLWPMSRKRLPKQFIAFFSDNSLIKETVMRAKDITKTDPIIICNKKHSKIINQHLSDMNISYSMVLEPIGKNTAPAVGVAAMSLDEDPLLLVLPSDHFIRDEISFKKSISNAIPLAEDGKLVTFGVVPSEPNVGYGYIKKGRKIKMGYAVEKFKEKPTIQKASEYLNSGNYLWNSGIFLFRSSQYLKELKKFRPDIYEACSSSISMLHSDEEHLILDKNEFSKSPSESIDYAVMEHTDQAVVVPLDCQWSDIGSWKAVWDLSEKDKDGNYILGNTKLVGTKESIVISEDKLTSVIGLNNLIVVSTKDVTLIANKDNDQDLKSLIDILEDKYK